MSSRIATASAVAASMFCLGFADGETPGPAPTPAPAPVAPATAPAGLPLAFEENGGRFDRPVRFVARDGGAAVAIDRAGARVGDESGNPVRLRLAGAAPAAIQGGGESQGAVHDLRPGAQSDAVRAFSQVRFRRAWRGVDVVFHGDRGALEYDVVVAPGADPSLARIRIEGGTPALATDGSLRVTTADGVLVQRAPVAFQRRGGRRVPVEARYVLRGRTASFALGRYDRSRELVIDPVLIYQTYLGGTGTDSSDGLVVDPVGNAYVLASTTQPDWLETIGTPAGGKDLVVTKLNSDASARIWATYYGGSGDDEGGGLALQELAPVRLEPRRYRPILVGTTSSTNFPGFPTPAPAGANGFVVGLSDTGSSAVFTRVLGGDGDDSLDDVVVGADDVVHVAGTSTSPTLSNAVGASQSTRAGVQDALVARLSAAGVVTYASLHGGAGTEVGDAVGVLGSDTLLGGQTTSSDLPGLSAGSFDSTLDGADGFVTRIAGGTRTSTLLGGTGAERIYDLATDPGAPTRVWLTGETASSGLSTPGVAIGTPPGGRDGLVAELSSDLSARHWSGYLGAGGNDTARGIVRDPATSALWIAGSEGERPNIGRLWRLSTDGRTLEARHAVGGSGITLAQHVASNPTGGFAWVAGVTDGGARVTSGVVQSSHRGGLDVFLAKADGDPPQTTITEGPSGEIQATSVTFAFASDEPGSTFQCSLDGTDLGACTSPKQLDVQPGGHVFRVVATDDAGNPDPTPADRGFTATVAPATTPAPTPAQPSLAVPFVASLTSVAGALPREPVLLDARASTGTPDLTYSWDLDGDGNFEIAPGPEPTRTRGFPAPGRYTVAVRVSDASGRIGEAKATVDVVKPLRLRPQFAVKGKNVSFKLNPEIPSGVPIHHYVYDFGDGSAPKVDRVSKQGISYRNVDVGRKASLSHRYKKPGLYRWSFAAIADNGQSHEVSGAVAIEGAGKTEGNLFSGALNGSKGSKPMWVSSDGLVVPDTETFSTDDTPVQFTLENVPTISSTVEINDRESKTTTVRIGQALWDMGDGTKKEGFDVFHTYKRKINPLRTAINIKGIVNATKSASKSAIPQLPKSAKTVPLPFDQDYHGQVTYIPGEKSGNKPAVIPFTVRPQTPTCRTIKIAEDLQAVPVKGTCFWQVSDGVYRTSPGAPLFVNGIEIRPKTNSDRVWFSESGTIGRDGKDSYSIYVNQSLAIPAVGMFTFPQKANAGAVREVPELSGKAAHGITLERQRVEGLTIRVADGGRASAEYHLGIPAPFGKETAPVVIPMSSAAQAKAAIHEELGLKLSIDIPDMAFGPIRAYDIHLEIDKRHWLIGGGNLEIFGNKILAQPLADGVQGKVTVNQGPPKVESVENGPSGFAVCDNECGRDKKASGPRFEYGGAIFLPKEPIALGPVGISKIGLAVKTDPFVLKGNIDAQIPATGPKTLTVAGCVQLEEIAKGDTTIQCVGDAETIDECVSLWDNREKNKFYDEAGNEITNSVREEFLRRYKEQKDSFVKLGIKEDVLTSTFICSTLARTSEFDQFWLRVQADVSLKDLRLGGGYFEYRTGGGGSVHAGGDAKLAVPGFSLAGQVEADFYFEPFQWQIFANIDANILGLSAGAQILANNELIAGCIDADLAITDVSVGAGYRWGGSVFALGGFEECNLKSDFGIVRKAGMSGAGDMLRGRAAPMARTSQTRTLPGGLRHMIFRVEGDGGVPRVRVTGPNGFVAEDPRPAGRPQSQGLLGPRKAKVRFLHFDQANAVAIAIAAPGGGEYKVEALPGSVPLKSTAVSRPEALPTIKAAIRRGSDGRRRIETFMAPTPGRVRSPYTVSIVEDSRLPSEIGRRVAPGGVRLKTPVPTSPDQLDLRTNVSSVVVPRVVSGTRSYDFNPAFGPAGKRVLYAVIENRGVLVKRIPLSGYIAPPPRPIKPPSGVKLQRKGSALTVGWNPVLGAQNYVVTVTRGDGSVHSITLNPAKSSLASGTGTPFGAGISRSPLSVFNKSLKTKVTLTGIPESEAVSAEVISRDAFQRISPPAKPQIVAAVEASPVAVGGVAEKSNPAPISKVKAQAGGK